MSQTAGTSEPMGANAQEWRRLTLVGLFVLVPTLVATQVIAQAVIPPLVVFVIVFGGLAAALLMGKGRRVLIASAVLAVLLVLTNLPFVIEDLVHPESIAGFLPAAVSLLAAMGVAVAGAMATRSTPPGAGRAFGAALAGVIALAAIGSVIATVGATSDDRQPGDVVVVAADTEYPDELDAPSGSVAFFLDNDDVYRHRFLIEGTDIAEEIPGARSVRVETTLEPGEYRYYCDIPGHEDMEGTLVVG